MRTSEHHKKYLSMFIVVLFLPVVAGDVLSENISLRLLEIPEKTGFTKTYGIFDPCNWNKPGNKVVSCAQLKGKGDDEHLVYEINPDNKVQVRCDMTTDGGGWTVIQRRGPYEKLEAKLFERTKDEYEKGFGDVGVSYWIGNDNLYRLTNFPNNNQVLRIELTKKGGDKITVNYDKFAVGSKSEYYKLTIGKYNGSDGYNALKQYNGAKFFIAEDKYAVMRLGCYPPLSGGWWFHECVHSNLNGRRYQSSEEKDKKGLGIVWFNNNDPKSYDAVYEQVEMKIRDADFEFCMGKMAK